LQWSKLEAVQELLRLRFKGIEVPKVWLAKTGSGQRQFSWDLLRPKSYWVALVHSQTIFAKPGGLLRILHAGVDPYLKALLGMKDLKAVADIPDQQLKSLTSTQFRDLMKGINGPLEIADGLSSEDEGALEDDPESQDEGGGRANRRSKRVNLCIEDIPAVDVSVGQLALKVHYDNFSHRSGRRRAWVVCPLHIDCEKWVFLHSHPNPRRAAAYLVAWMKLGFSVKRRNQAQKNLGLKPTNSEVDSCLDDLPEA
jgi:hypothetical protein